MKLPIALVQTWLELSSNNNPDSPEAYKRSINNIRHHFGSIGLAEVYVRTYVREVKRQINDNQ